MEQRDYSTFLIYNKVLLQEKALIDKKYRVFEGLCMDVVTLFLIGIGIYLIGFIWMNTEEKRYIRDRLEEEKKLEFIDKKKGDNEYYDMLKPVL